MKYLSILIISCIISSVLEAAPSRSYIDKSLERAANTVGVPTSLLKAICWAESNHQPSAFVYGDGGPNNHAFGLCQVTYATAKQLGFKDPRCERDFRGYLKIYKTCKLFGPYTNAYYAAKYLKSRLNRYNDSWISAIAAYNTGSLKTCKTGKVFNSYGRLLYSCEIGGLLNQKYVDRVLNSL